MNRSTPDAPHVRPSDGSPTGDGKRRYRMTARAEAARATGEAILDAAWSAFRRLPYDRVTLGEIAEAAGVTVQTVIRRFGSKDGLFGAVADREGARIIAARTVPADAGLEAALEALIDHYETDGDVITHLIAQEHVVDLIGDVVREGRRVHRDWVETHCRDLLGGIEGVRRTRIVHAAIAATDLFTWKLLRRDLALERADVEATMLELLDGLGGNPR